MNILYTSVFRDGTGYAKGAINTALAIDTIKDINLHCLNIKLANQIIEPPNRIQELFNNRLEKYDTIIQHVLPPMMEYFPGVKNIGYGYFETSHILPSNWQFNLNLMDELWVSSEQNKHCLLWSGVKKPIKVVPIPYVEQSLPDKPNNFGIGTRYAFYHIGDWSSRKNTLNLVRAYLTTFNSWDHVVLVLKSYVEGMVADQSRQFINNEINELKKSLRKAQYPPIILITEYLSDANVADLHAQGNCFVSMERGAAWNLPAYEAVANNNAVIVPDSGGPLEFMDKNKPGHILINTRPEYVHGMTRCPYTTLYTSFETWDDPSPFEMSQAMRHVFTQRPVVDNSYLLENFNIHSCGQIFEKALND